jgi:regulator of RNase E activity RraA
MSNIGWRCLPSPASADPRILNRLRELPVSLNSDNMGRGVGGVGLRAYHKGGAMAGTAITVRTRPGDNLVIYRALDHCRPGDVMVIDGGGDVNQALVGEILSRLAESLGLGGLVIDGAIRDLGAIAANDFPVYARGVTHRGPYKHGPGEINVPVAAGGLVVNAGDIVVGDENGVVAFAPGFAPELIDAATKQGEKEAAALRAIAEGRYDRSWVALQVEKMMAI